MPATATNPKDRVDAERAPSDRDIRPALRDLVMRLHEHESHPVVVEELGLCQAAALVDLAVIGDGLHGYEIKSDRDSLRRLPAQQSVFNRTLDTVTLVAGRRHLDAIVNRIPAWWGLLEVVLGPGGVSLARRRETLANPETDPRAVVQLLWRDEVLAVLKERGIARGLSGSRRQVMWTRLVGSVDAGELGAIVRSRLKARAAGANAGAVPRGGTPAPAAPSVGRLFESDGPNPRTGENR